MHLLLNMRLTSVMSSLNLANSRPMIFVVAGHGGRRSLHSFPTRRSSDLVRPHPEKTRRVGAAGHAVIAGAIGAADHGMSRSEEHTSELQSRQYLVCRLLLEKKKKLSERSLDNSSSSACKEFSFHYHSAAI